eukprot:3973342-Prymnesium_polylepis.1
MLCEPYRAVAVSARATFEERCLLVAVRGLCEANVQALHPLGPVHFRIAPQRQLAATPKVVIVQ